MLDCALTGVLSLLILALSNVFGWGFPYWVALLIAAVVVFIGELMFAARDGDGWDFY